MNDVKALKRMRWAVRAVLALGIAASIAANVLHARSGLIAQVISAWSPLALLLAVDAISRVPSRRRLLGVARLGAAGAIACIAAWVSYWHMAAVAARYGETASAAHLLPLSVDGLVVVASVSLVELADRIRATTGEVTAGQNAPVSLDKIRRPTRHRNSVQRARVKTAGQKSGAGRPGPGVAELARVRAILSETGDLSAAVTELGKSERTLKRWLAAPTNGHAATPAVAAAGQNSEA